MDDPITILHREWPVIEQAPWSAGTIALGCLIIGWTVGRFLGSERIRILLGRIDQRDDEIKRLNTKIAEFPTSPERKHIRSSLSVFLDENEALQSQCLKSDPPVEKINDWVKRLADFLNLNLDASYVTRLNSTSGFMESEIVGNYSVEQKQAATWLGHRAIRLTEFLSELSR